MPWTKQDYPVSMKNLPEAVRNKAVEIANALLKEKSMDEGRLIATAISRAKDWAANRGKLSESQRGSKKTDVKKHGEDLYVIPGDEGWTVKKEKDKKSKTFNTKREATNEARKEAKQANSSMTIQRKNGKIEKRVSYNPNRIRSKQKT